jgi:hypothetical protein
MLPAEENDKRDKVLNQKRKNKKFY